MHVNNYHLTFAGQFLYYIIAVHYKVIMKWIGISIFYDFFDYTYTPGFKKTEAKMLGLIVPHSSSCWMALEESLDSSKGLNPVNTPVYAKWHARGFKKQKETSRF